MDNSDISDHRIDPERRGAGSTRLWVEQEERQEDHPIHSGNIYYVREDLRASERFIESGIGFGLTGGVDLDIGRLMSIPIEAMYIGTGGDAIDDLSGFGVSVGVNFNF